MDKVWHIVITVNDTRKRTTIEWPDDDFAQPVIFDNAAQEQFADLFGAALIQVLNTHDLGDKKARHVGGAVELKSED